jgi:hypothetical protein
MDEVSGRAAQNVDSQISPAKRNALHGRGRFDRLLVFINIIRA